jgi:hypothetical protein
MAVVVNAQTNLHPVESFSKLPNPSQKQRKSRVQCLQIPAQIKTQPFSIAFAMLSAG